MENKNNTHVVSLARDNDVYKERMAAVIRITRATKFVKEDTIPCKIEEGLYLGSLGSANNKSALKSLNVTHILTVANSLPIALPNDFKYKIVEVCDRSDVTLLPFFDECFAFIEEARTTGGAVLVHCFAGRSKSVTIIVAYLMFKNGMSLSEAMEHVKGKRPVVSPNSGFMLQLADYERYLREHAISFKMANRAQNMTEMARLSGKEPGSNLAPRPQAPQNPSGGSNHPNRARTGPSSQVSNPVRNITDPSTQNQARGSVQSYQPNGSQRSTRSRETDSSTPESTRANKRPRDENEVCCWAVHKYFEGPLENIENYCEEVVRVYASNSSRSSGHGMQYILEDCAKVQANFVVKVGENEPFVSQLLTTLRTTIKNLEPHQIHSFYESKWAEIIGQARQSVDYLKDPDVIRAVLNILQTNTSAATSLGTYFLPQITLIFLDMLNVYSMYSELISTSISQGDPYASRTSHVKLLRSVKRETLKLIETFLDKAEDQSHIGIRFVRPMMDLVLDDYARNVPETRESEVLSLFATIINKYKESMIKDVPRIFEAVFACTLEMIRENFEDYPEHRLKFLSLLQAMATHCFRALIKFSSKQIMDSIIWLSGTLNEILPKLDSTFYWRC